MATKKCPMCAEEIQEEALICRYCGHRFDGAPAAAAPLPPPEAPTVMPQGEVREGIVPSGRQLFGYYLESIVIIACLVVTVFGMGAGALAWGETDVAWARPAPIFMIGVFVILIAWSIGVRELAPRIRQKGFYAAGRAFRRGLHDRYGVSRLLRPRGLVAGVVVSILVWAAMEASAIYNYRDLVDGDWRIQPGMYAALVLPAVGILAALLVLGRGRRMVRMDAEGTIFE